MDFDKGETRAPRKIPLARLGLIKTQPTYNDISELLSSLKAAMMAIKMSLESKHLGNGDYFL